MTMLDERPITGATPAPPPLRDRGLLAPWRLAARLARRETRRRPGRTILAALLIAVPVLAMTVGSVLVRTEAEGSAWEAQFAARWPGADVVIEEAIEGDVVQVDAFGNETQRLDRSAIEELLPRGSRVVDALWVYTQVQVTGSDPEFVDLIWTDLPLDDPISANAVDIIDGRTPVPGEILLDVRVARDLGVDVGDRLVLDRPSGEWIVSGIGRYRADYWRRIAVVPGFDRERIVDGQRSITTMIDLPRGTSPAETSAIGKDLYGITPYEPSFDPFEDTGTTLAWGWVGGVLALVAVGIIVTAAFATSARRQLVAVGQLASNGATPSVIRRTLALQGTWTAAVGALAGMGIGLATLPFATPVVERWILQRDMPGYSIAPWDLVAIVATALVAGTLAAAVPARSLSKVPVMAALAGRRPLGRPPRWLVPTGVVLTLGGLGLMALAGAGAGASDATGGDIFALGIVVAAVAVVFGMVCMTPLVVERAGRIAAYLPLSPRLALRGMARVRTRSAAVVAAIAVAVGGSIAMAMVADDALTDNYYGDAFLPEDAVVIRAYDAFGPVVDDPETDAPVDPPLLPPLDLSDAQRAAVEEQVPNARIEPLTVAGFDPPSFRWSQQTIYWVTGEGPLIATRSLMDVIGMSRRDRDLLDEVGVLLLRSPDVEESVSFYGDVWGSYEVDGRTVELRPTLSKDVPRYGFGFQQLVVSEAFASEIGFTPVTRGAIVRGDAAIDDEAGTAMREAFTTEQPIYSAFVEPGDAPRSTPVIDGPAVGWDVSWSALYRPDDARDLWIARSIIVGVALLISSLVVAIGLSLAAAEGRDERDTLTIVGATPATMRRQTSTRAVTMALIGIVLGIPTGFLPTWVLWGAIDGDWPPFPWVTSLLLLAAVPLAVAGAAWLASAVGQRLRPASPTRRD